MNPAVRFDRPATATAILMVVLVVTVYGTWTAAPLVQRTTSPAQPSDAALFATVAARVSRGDAYYDAMRAELAARGYPTGSVFNWRPPALTWIAAFAPMLGRGVLATLGVVVIAGTFWYLRTLPLWLALVGVCLQLGATVPAFIPQGLYLPEAWSGLLIAASILGYARGWTRLGAICAVLAVVARDLALPYALICFWFARDDRRWMQVGLTLVSVYYAWHLSEVIDVMPTHGAQHPSWIALGGWPFIVSTVRAAGWFLVLPAWIAAFAASLVLVSPVLLRDRLRATVVTYLALFAVIGLPFNAYWGLLTAPAWALALPTGLLVVRYAIRH